jgi:PAS domain S-box-containing protein
MSTLSRLVGRRRFSKGRGKSATKGRSRRPAWALEGLEQQLFDHSPAAVLVSDVDDRILAVNAAYSLLTGYSQDEVLGHGFDFNHIARDPTVYSGMAESLATRGCWVGEFRLRSKEGETFPAPVTRLRLCAADGTLQGYLTLSTDLVGDDARRIMLWQAHYDPLTRLPNRNLLERQVAALLQQVDRQTRGGALLSIDLDRFQIVNDSIGPALADQLLREVAYRIALCLGEEGLGEEGLGEEGVSETAADVAETCTLARMGRDHFVLLISEPRSVAEVERLGRRILDVIHQPYHLDARELIVTGSVGVAMLPQHGRDTGELLQKADAARLQVKRQGGNGLAFFEPEMNARAERRLELESALRRAVANDQLMLHYQPVVDAKRGVVTSAEALLRWEHPELGLISPAEFIPVAEDMGLIVEIGEWVVQECRRQLESWRGLGAADLRISLNVSPVQLRRENDVQALLALLRDDRAAAARDDGAEVPSNGLIIELTESALMENSERVQRYLEQARSVGSMVALDDFGTGFSSLACLRHIEFDVLKIDKSFIDGLANARDFGLVASIVSMGRILGMRVVAEGVETLEQVQRLRQIGCDYIQGYYFSRPLPAEEFYRFLAQGVRPVS